MMSYSEHRPGRFGSDGRIEFEAAAPAAEEPLYLSDLKAEEERRRTQSETAESAPKDAGPDDTTAVIARTTASQQSAIFDQDAPSNAAQELRDAVRGIRSAREGSDNDVAETTAFGESKPEPVSPESTQLAQAETTVLPQTAPQPPRATPDFEPIERATILTGGGSGGGDGEQPTRRRDSPRLQRGPWRRMAILGGAEGDIIDHVPSETGRFVQMFLVLAGTAGISGISMMFALITGVKVVIILAIPLAIIWTVIIFNLDRFLTSTMKASTSVWKLIALAIPRVIMAAIIGVVVAEPLVLQIFSNDIQREVNATNIAQAQADQRTLETGPEKVSLDAASKRLADLENQASTGIVSGTSTESATLAGAQTKVDGLKKQLTDQQATIDKARAIYQCELTGQGAGSVPGCTGIAGNGSSSDAAKAQLDSAQAAYGSLSAELVKANAELATAQASSAGATSANEERNRKEAKDQLPAAKTSYDTALAAYNSRAEAVSSANAGASGLLSQITALNRLAQKEPSLGLAHWMIAALFFMIELLPVLVKVLTSYGAPSLYEQTANARRQVEYDRIQAKAFRDRADIASGATA